MVPFIFTSKIITVATNFATAFQIHCVPNTSEFIFSWVKQFNLDVAKTKTYGADMKQKRMIVLTIALATAFLFVCAILVLGVLQKPSVSLAVNGRTVAVVKQPFIEPFFGDASADVYVGKSKLFSMGEDFSDGPTFIYPFPDGKRFLCDYDDDIAMLDFVVDFRDSTNNPPNMSQWPPDSDVRECLTRGATNIVYNTRGSVRLPTYRELQEVSDFLNGKETVPIKAGYLNFMSIGSKKSILMDLATNRNSCWPLEAPVKPAKN